MSSAFNDLIEQLRSARLPPVDSWTPERVGEIDIRIRRDGTWLHEGTEIRRQSIARVFSTVLKREGDDYFLVTPVEKLHIEVDDVPFTAVDFEVSQTGRDQSIVFKTNLGDVVLLDIEHPLMLETGEKCEVKPLLHVRSRLYARLLRDVFYRLADYVESPDANPLVIWSAGERFVVG